ncbi:MAG: hypothetical protein Q4D38_14045 [Planctomycetia bacterium]|nr:hypothetical protein [Planctomycetia bacterium]
MAYLMGETSASRQGDKSLEKNGTVWRQRRQYSREYTVLADSFDESEESILRTVPRLGSVLGGCICKSVSVKEVEGVIHPRTKKLTALWKISCSFDSDVLLDPLELDPEVRWSAEQEEEALWQDVETGEAIQTKCGEQIPITRHRVIPVLEIKRYMEFPFNPNILLNYTNTINALEFWGAPPQHALLASIECDYVEIELSDTQKKKYAHVSYRIKFKFDPHTDQPWQASPLHYGNLTWGDGEKTFVTQIIDREGRPKQGLLDAEGYELGPSLEPVFLKFNQFLTKDWTSLGINRQQIGY